jgi:hypothetical protein
MSRRSNKAVTEILASSSSSSRDEISLELGRKITLATEGFATNKFCELILRDRSRLKTFYVFVALKLFCCVSREKNMEQVLTTTIISLLRILQISSKLLQGCYT